MKTMKTWAARLGLCLAVLAVLAALFVPVCAYADDGEYIIVRKTWQHGNVPEGERPQSVKVSILAGGDSTTSSSVPRVRYRTFWSVENTEFRLSTVTEARLMLSTKGFPSMEVSEAPR